LYFLYPIILSSLSIFRRGRGGRATSGSSDEREGEGDGEGEEALHETET